MARTSLRKALLEPKTRRLIELLAFNREEAHLGLGEIEYATGEDQQARINRLIRSGIVLCIPSTDPSDARYTITDRARKLAKDRQDAKRR